MSTPIVDNEIKLNKSNPPLSSHQASLPPKLPLKLTAKTDNRRHIVLIGAGFAGIRCLEQLAKYSADRITLVDRNDYHFFPPLIYQVSAGFLASSDISYPLRRFIENYDNVRYRQGNLLRINTKDKVVTLDTGNVSYDRLIIATGAETNYFGNKDIEAHALPMKTIKDALSIRNHMLAQFNYAASLPVAEREPYLSIVIAGGGPSGVELAGVMSEIRLYTLHKEYPELLENVGGITLVTADPVLLAPMSAEAQRYTQLQMEKFKVDLVFSDPVARYDGHIVTLKSGKTLHTHNLIWTAGVTCEPINGLNPDDYGRGNRLVVNSHLALQHHKDIYALGDIALATHDDNYPNGHPQLGQVASSQGTYLGKYLSDKTVEPFQYKHSGDMAMIGRLTAVADIKGMHLKGIIAWLAWVVIHILSLSTAKNRLATTWNWMTAFLTGNQSFRMGIQPHEDKFTLIKDSTAAKES
ncbi:NAD(P)/FAD-dependent oxidoreductase [Psychrobacter sp. Pi2-51]|uniref:NAD(P)/FAD-dependent oxidoreductase n=1 Tax=Psychrobacter sp. Pi2-51 TaxID=2774132 RepID=UPI001D12340B|nr:NAD(P)/FAD-dependent oxidoreductase [Psychrobacter sp. Pi2-51]